MARREEALFHLRTLLLFRFICVSSLNLHSLLSYNFPPFGFYGVSITWFTRLTSPAIFCPLATVLVLQKDSFRTYLAFLSRPSRLSSKPLSRTFSPFNSRSLSPLRLLPYTHSLFVLALLDFLFLFPQVRYP